ncbi:MAG: serine/threonine-protein kinase [Mastigocoleus sp.]
MSDPNIGRLLGKRYHLQKLIGTGAMGRVYRAQDVLLGGVPVAVKFLALSIQNKKMRLQERFEREAKTCASLGQKSIHVVRVMDYGVDEKDTPFYVMEYLQGKSLSRIIRTENLNLTRFLSVVRQIALGLQCAHDGIEINDVTYPIIHRDIKPSNIIILEDPSFGELVKILDFGIAKLLQANTDHTNYYLGTLAYSSPEQMEGKELDERSDIYSLGIMMFEMLSGKMPIYVKNSSFGAWYKAHHYQQPRSFDDVFPQKKFPPQLENLVMNCLAKHPSDRPLNIVDILHTLDVIESKIKSTSSNSNIKDDEISNAPTLQVDFEKQEKSKLEGNNHSHLSACIVRDEMNRSYSWPKNKPIADIVFPHVISINKKYIPSLWAMLPLLEIQKRAICTRYNQFLFITAPHPMLLWITVIYSRQHGAKWLTYYLDLKTQFGQQVALLLGNMGYYHLLLFASEVPEKVNHTLVSTIAPAQSQRLQKWVKISYTLNSYGNPQFSKNLLKAEYIKIKPQIISKLQTIDTDSPFDLSSC